MASALANRARGAIVGSAVADAAGKKLVFYHLLATFKQQQKKPNKKNNIFYKQTYVWLWLIVMSPETPYT